MNTSISVRKSYPRFEFLPFALKDDTKDSDLFSSVRFNFGAQFGRPIPVNEQTVARTRSLANGRCDAVFMWWDIFMDPDKKVRLSCAPRWAHPTPEDLVITSGQGPALLSLTDPFLRPYFSKLAHLNLKQPIVGSL